MKAFKTKNIRNIALVSHNGAGKTTLVERILFESGVITRMGSVQNGNTVMDFEREEIERESSISTAIAAIEYEEAKINLFDTPGYIDFVGEVNATMRVADGVAVVVDALAGVEVGTELVWESARKHSRPIMLVANKMDRENVRVSRLIDNMKENLVDDARLIYLQLPIGQGVTFKGVIDLLSMKAFMGEKGDLEDIPADMLAEAKEARVTLVEAAAEGDDVLMEKYFADEPISAEEIMKGVRVTTRRREIVPLIFCSGLTGIGVQAAAKVFHDFMPLPHKSPPIKVDGFRLTNSSEGPLAGFVFKTREDQYGKTSYIRMFSGVLEPDSRVWDSALDQEVRIGRISILRGKEMISVPRLNSGDIGVVVKLGDSQTNHTLCSQAQQIKLRPIDQAHPIYSLAIHPVSQADTAKLNPTLARLGQEDTTLVAHYESATRQLILSGMGDTHLGIAVNKMASKFGVNVTTSIPRIPYRETITKTSSAEHTHKKQSGGAGQYARVFLRVESTGDDADFEFSSEIFGGSISQPFVAATEKGCRAAVASGIMAGYPVTGVKAIVYDGKEHPVDSKDIAFQTAGREAFRSACRGASPTLLEPIYLATVTVQSGNMGDILGDFNTRRARVLGVEQVGPRAVIQAEVPLAEMQRYQADLRSMTQGRGVYSLEFRHYGRVPTSLQEKIIEDSKAD